MKKGIWAACLTLCLWLALLPGTASTAESLPTSGTCGAEGDNVTWRLEETENGVTLTISGSGKMADSFGPNDAWKPFKSQISIVIVEDGVTSIGTKAFSGCENLTSATIPGSVETIGDYAFSECGLRSITIPEGVKAIEARAFAVNHSLLSVTLPKSVATLKQDAFRGCAALTSITVSAEDELTGGFCSFDGALYSKLGKANELFCCPEGKTSCELSPDCTSIGNYAFKDCGRLTSVQFPEGVTEIGYAAFENCTALESVAFSKQLTDIGGKAFSNCTSLTSAVLPDLLTHIRIDAFKNCTALESVTLPASLVDLDNSVFSGCAALTSMVIPEKVKTISLELFSGCTNLETVHLPKSLTTIYGRAFFDCVKLKEIFYGGSEENWNELNIDSSNYAVLGKVKITYGTSTPTDPTTPSEPGVLPLTAASGGLGQKLTARVTGGHWLTIQVTKGSSIAISYLQAPGSGGTAEVVFSAPAGSRVQVWETETEMTFVNGVPQNPILSKAERTL